MTESNLLEAVVDSLSVKEIHPLYKAMLEECCEKVLESVEKPINQSTKQLITLVSATFLTANGILKATLKASLKMADNVCLNYRGEEFSINCESSLLNDE